FPCSGRRSNGADDILCKVQLYPADADKAEQQHRTLAVLLEVGLKLVLADHNLQQRLDHDLHPELSSRQPTHHRRVCPASKPVSGRQPANGSICDATEEALASLYV